jgi:RNA polymerase sigma factor (sigma-70 family)
VRKGEQAKAPSTPGALQEMAYRLVENQAAFQAFLRKRVSDEAVVEDLFQQCLLRAVERHHSVNNQESVVAWFYRILRNAVIDYYRARATQESRQEVFEKETEVLGDREAPPPDDVKAAICACLDGVVNTLRPGYSELIRRIDLGGESTSVVAKSLQISSGNATVRLHRARQALRQSLEKVCGICTKHGCLNCTCP